MHLAVDAGDVAVGFDDGGGVVVEAGGAAFEQGGDETTSSSRRWRRGVGGGAGDGFGEGEEGVVFALAEVLGAEEFGEADDVRAGAGGFADAVGGVVEVGGVAGAQDIWMRATRLLMVGSCCSFVVMMILLKFIGIR